MTDVRTFRRAVVAGGAGFLGRHVCDALLARGTEVVCVDDLSTGTAAAASALESAGAQVLRHDVCDGVPVDGPVDLVMHLASPASPPAYQRRPLETLLVGSQGTLHLLRLAQAHGARFLLTSTSEVYGEPEVHPQPEWYRGAVDPVGPRSMYDESKRFAEAMTAVFRRTYGVDTAIARLFNSYGPGMRLDDGRVVTTLVAQALRGEPLTVAGEGSQTRSFCYVDDTVRGILALAASDVPGPMNIGSAQEMTVLALAERIVRLTGSRSPVQHVDRPLDDPTVRRPDLSLARRLLGWEPRVTVDDGLRRTIAWARAELDVDLRDHAERRTDSRSRASTRTSEAGTAST